MPQIINSNIASLTTQRNLNRTQGELNIALQRLSSGLRINSAKDDAAGLAISERFTTQIRGLNQAVRNANDGISFAQTAEGALSTVGNSLQRIRELAVQSVNDTNSAQDRQALNNEVQQLVAEVNRIASSTQFNGQNILDGTLEDLVFQVGANQNQTISVDGVDTRGSQLGARTVGIDSFSQTSLNTLVSSNDLYIQGTQIDLSGFATSTVSDADLVGAINAESATTGVQALRGTTNSITFGVDQTGTTGGDTFSVNGVNVSYNFGATVTDTANNLISSFNALEEQTGLTAEAGAVGGEIVLSNNSGQSIEFAATGGGDLATQFTTGQGDFTADPLAQTFHAGITFAGDVSDVGYQITGTLTTHTGVAGTELNLAVEEVNQINNTLNGVDVLTGDSATDALLTLDFALQQVSGLRSELGAVQTRFESTISNLQVTTENLSAARSRIQDADFAQETAALTRAQILQQAGVSVLSQANALPQLALSLLQ